VNSATSVSSFFFDMTESLLQEKQLILQVYLSS